MKTSHGTYLWDLRRYQTILMLPLPFLLTAIMEKRKFIFLKVRHNFNILSYSLIFTKQSICFFFLGDQYYKYEFKHQPSHKECIQMSLRSPSSLFSRYTDIYFDRWVEHFNQLFGGGNTFLGQAINIMHLGKRNTIIHNTTFNCFFSSPKSSRWPSLHQQRLDWDQITCGCCASRQTLRHSEMAQ